MDQLTLPTPNQTTDVTPCSLSSLSTPPSLPPSLLLPSCSSYTTHAHVRKREARVRPCASVFPTQATATLGRVSLSVCCLPVHSVPLLFAQSLCLSSELTHTHTVTRKTTESLPLSLALCLSAPLALCLPACLPVCCFVTSNQVKKSSMYRVLRPKLVHHEEDRLIINFPSTVKEGRRRLQTGCRLTNHGGIRG